MNKHAFAHFHVLVDFSSENEALGNEEKDEGEIKEETEQRRKA